MDIKCRVCLATTEAKMYHSLSMVFSEYMKSSLSVKELLELVTSSSVATSNDLPNSICTACLKQLKDCYTFIEKFKVSQMWLQQNICVKVGTEHENIIIKVEENDDCLYPLIDRNDTVHTSYVEKQLKVNADAEEKKVQEQKMKLKKTKHAVKVKKKIGSIEKEKFRKHGDSVIIMSVEDVLNRGEKRLEHNENMNNLSANEDLHDTEENNVLHNDHTYQKRPDSNLFIMSVEDVINSSTKPRVTTAKRKRTKGIISKSVGPVKIKTDEKEHQNFVCDICGKIYSSFRRLKVHKYGIHPPELNEKLKCNICGQICKTRSSYTHHKRKHQGKQINCDECDKVYLTTTQLKEHKKRIHGEGLPDKFLCNECGKRFKYSNALKYHVVSVHHENDKQYMCRYCGFKCVQKSYLNRHERCHTNERPYKCKFCDKAFRGSAELQTHHAYHEGKTRYNCKYCGKGFVQTWNMRVHSLQHAGNYECTICSRRFIDTTVLSFHYFHHHKIRDDGKEASDSTNSTDEQENADVDADVDPDAFLYEINDDPLAQDNFAD